ncbi:MAG: hypothetical protein ABI634_11855 [Acidobacteriota bacterium]
MTPDEFRASLAAPAPPSGISSALVALWYDGRGDWSEAHRVAQDVHDERGAHVHAYLHRKEGDDSNAHYWYRRAGAPPFVGSLDDEWKHIVRLLLERVSDV